MTTRYDSVAAPSEGSGPARPRQVSDRLCGCGCGQYTLIADRTRGHTGARRGEPLRFIYHHSTSPGRPPRPRDRRCNPDTLLDCVCCGAPMHAASQRMRECADGHTSMVGRGLCRDDYYAAERNGTIADYPPTQRSRGELLEEWEWMRGQGVGYREFPARMGMTFAAWERAFLRARKAGDPRAVRAGEAERCAA